MALFFLVLLAFPCSSRLADAALPQILKPFEMPAAGVSDNAPNSGSAADRAQTTAAPADNGIDWRVLARIKQEGLEPAPLCSDEVFIRRAFLDLIGALPEAGEVRAFLEDNRPDKRAILIDSLLEREEFAVYWALKWSDILRVKAEFPINLWPNAVQVYHRWILDSIRANKPYDQFARELLTSSGSNFRTAPVNFYRAVQSRTPSGLAEAAALTFMGTRLDKQPERERTNLAAFFSRVVFKKTNEWKEEIVCNNPASSTTLEAVLPDGARVQIEAEQDPRVVFADWLTAPKNPWFARNWVNRAWLWTMGRGIIQPADDIRPDNPPANPELLAYLEKEFVDSHYDMRQIFRLILNSRTYQQSSIPRAKGEKAEALFAYYPARRLEAEVLIDALDSITGGGEKYSSAIPEPFTFIPDEHKTIELADGSITSSFLEMFGRPPRDTGLESERNNQPSDAQRLYWLNSSQIQQKIERSQRLRSLLQGAKGNRLESLRLIYLSVLSRYPTDEESATAQEYFKTPKQNPKQAMDDLVWALMNTKEFLYRH